MQIDHRPQSVREFLELMHAPATASATITAPAVTAAPAAVALVALVPFSTPSSVAPEPEPDGFAVAPPREPLFPPVALRPREPNGNNFLGAIARGGIAPLPAASLAPKAMAPSAPALPLDLSGISGGVRTRNAPASSGPTALILGVGSVIVLVGAALL